MFGNQLVRGYCKASVVTSRSTGAPQINKHAIEQLPPICPVEGQQTLNDQGRGPLLIVTLVNPQYATQTLSGPMLSQILRKSKTMKGKEFEALIGLKLMLMKN